MSEKLPGEEGVDKAREAAGAEARAKQAAEAAGEPWTGGEYWGTIRDEINVLDPENAAEWFTLLNRVGIGPVERLLAGGVRGLSGLTLAAAAVEADMARAKRTAEWLANPEPLTLAESGRVPLLKAGGDNYLPGGVVGLVVAGGGTGKTTFLAELAVRVAYGADMACPPLELARTNSKPINGPVMLVLAEEDEEGAQAAIRRGMARAGIEVEAGATPKNITLWAGADHNTALGEQVQLDDPVRGRTTSVVPSRFHTRLCEVARETGPLLIVLDPINQLLPIGGSENDAITAGALIRLAGELRAAAEEGARKRWDAINSHRTGATYDWPRPVVLIAHHERKAAGGDAGADAARGSTAFVDNARWVLRMTREKPPAEDLPAQIFWTVVKSNYTRQQTHVAAIDPATGQGGLVWRQWEEKDTLAWEAEEVKQEAQKALRKEQVKKVKAELEKGSATPAPPPAEDDSGLEDLF